MYNKIKQARKDAGLTQSQAAALVYSSLRTWQNWERYDNMNPAIFDYFLIRLLHRHENPEKPNEYFSEMINRRYNWKLKK